MTAAKRTSRDVGIRQLPSGSWQARYRDAEHVSHQRVFASKTDAKRWRAQQVAAVHSGLHVSPSDRRTVLEWATSWVEARPVRSSTTKRYLGMVSAHLVGTPLGAMRLVDVRPSHVQAWVTSRSLQLKPSTLERLFTFVRTIFKAARQDRLIVWSPCDGVTLPQADRVEHVLVTQEQVDAIEIEVPDRYRALVRLLAVCGLRIGEALALRPEDIDRERQVIRVHRTLDQKARSVGPVKSARHSKREVPVDRAVLTMLAAHQLAHPPRWHDDPSLAWLLFTSGHGRPLRYDSVAYKVFKPATVRARAAGVTPHDLRHYAGSAMLFDGVPPESVAKALGHSVQTLLSTYAHPLPSGDDLVRASMARRSRGGTPVAHGTIGEVH